MTSRQYVACTFSPGGRPYTYHADDLGLEIGDVVIVAGKGSAGRSVEVVEILDEPPPFHTKPVLRRPAPPEDEALATAGQPAADDLDVE